MAAIHAAAMAASRPWSEAEFADLASDPLIFSVSLDDGFALGRAVAGEAELLTLAVSPEAQHRGVGARLLAGFEAEAGARGAAAAFLEVAEDNAPARTLYARSGWQEAGYRPAYYTRRDAPAAGALVLRKMLT